MVKLKPSTSEQAINANIRIAIFEVIMVYTRRFETMDYNVDMIGDWYYDLQKGKVTMNNTLPLSVAPNQPI
jgi:hypothetical protein